LPYCSKREGTFVKGGDRRHTTKLLTTTKEANCKTFVELPLQFPVTRYCTNVYNTGRGFIFNISNFVHRNEDRQPANTDDGQILQLNVGNQMNNARADNSGNTLDIIVTSETADSDHNKVYSTDLIHHISTERRGHFERTFPHYIVRHFFSHIGFVQWYISVKR
jgi:hypothetical protein